MLKKPLLIKSKFLKIFNNSCLIKMIILEQNLINFKIFYFNKYFIKKKL